MNYLIYPLKYMNITQTYNGSTSHKPHTTGTPKDYPIDDGEKDSGQGYFYCPCDEVQIVRIYGVGNSGTNTVWIQSTTQVDFACGAKDYMTMQITHMNDSTLRNLKIGQKFKRKQAMFLEGSDGATANHFHISVGKGKMSGNGWTNNSNGKWVLTASNGTYKPENAFYIDKSFTTVKSMAGLPFKYLPTTTAKTTTTTTTTKKTESFLPARGYFKKGDSSPNVGKIADFMYKTFPSYTSKEALGNYYGDNIIKAITEFQRRTGLEPDGCTGAKTLAKLEKYGFKK